ncbi:carbonyl reductase [NADPH] 1-like [Ruditapes philippinarum]|uniref:carbonyl reductase [NADPH] 1-like n=1 Tax=Ruditapes philippinarum TaxID=129788 RepID=UPI00295BEA17|nr:carbonyl reductase [NADPH] 1-like [Ruditapes philippinarum]XP_060570920.1 carbonyl reductase [NADPH] 1-like [Ruditapes philippinarum]
MVKKVAIVTGANRGIGFQVARQLLYDFPGDVIVTGRDTAKGQSACKKLAAEGLKPVWHELDVTQSASIRMFVDFIRENYGGIDVLVNNAGTVFEKDSPLSMYRQAELSIQTNFKGTMSLIRYFLPLLRPHARVVMLSSELGKLSSLGKELRKQIDLDKVTMFDLDKLADKYLAAIKAKVWSEYGWPDRILESISVLLNVFVYALARDLKSDQRRNILVNACCPGWTATEQMKTHLDESGCLGGVEARSPEEAAADVTRLALLPSGTSSPNGDTVYKRQIINIRD